MNMSIREVAGAVSVVTALVGLTLTGSSEAWAQQKAGSSAKQLMGHWAPVSVTVEQGGKKVEPFGPNPKGLFIFDRSGRYSIVLLRPGVAKFASNNREAGTADENKAAVQGTLAHVGTYAVNEKEGSYNLRIESSSFPNWSGTDQKRLFTVSGDELRITNPTPSQGSGTALVVLKRVK